MRIPLDGTNFFASGQAQDTSVGLGFDLDSPHSEALVEQYGTILSPARLYFSAHTMTMPGGGQQVFEMVAETKLHACSFRYVFTILDGGKETHQTISRGANWINPFVISAA